MNGGPDVQRLTLAAPGPGSRRHLTIIRYGEPDRRPKAYLHAALHADEIPGLLVLHHLRALLDGAAKRGEMIGQVVLNPFANPIGLSQRVNGRLLGRHALTGAGNFNRKFPDVTERVAADVAQKLGGDGDENVQIIRHAICEALDAQAPLDDTDWLRITLLRLAYDADIVLDLHCDEEALLHLYLGTSLWPAAADLSAQLGSRATLLATDSGGDPFDEAVAGVWWALAERLPDKPIPAACLSATIELRGETDVDDALAQGDAENIFAFLQRRGVIAGDPGAVPEAACQATPLEAVDVIRAPVPGIVTYTRVLGDTVESGDVVAVLVDPDAAGPESARTEVCATASGLLFTRRHFRFARPGDVLCKVAGTLPLAYRLHGQLLSD